MRGKAQDQCFESRESHVIYYTAGLAGRLYTMGTHHVLPHVQGRNNGAERYARFRVLGYVGTRYEFPELLKARTGGVQKEREFDPKRKSASSKSFHVLSILSRLVSNKRAVKIILELEMF